MEDYNKIIESLGVRFLKAKHMKVLEPVQVDNFYDVENVIMLVQKGELHHDGLEENVAEGECLFIPGGKNVSVSFGANATNRIHNDDFLNNRERYLQILSDEELSEVTGNVYTAIYFEAKVFDSVNFFASLDIPSFRIADYSGIPTLMREIARESDSNTPGKDRVVKLSTDRLVVEILRFILDRKLFVEQFATNTTYFNDPRLLDIFAYIRENIAGDLSNKVLAGVANVSEDYVGQYFKMLTGINPQDYIEYQRMEKAVTLLRTTKKSIRDIGKDVGYKDTAYFCRRFKMMFGIPAGKMRRRESLMNV